MKKIFVALLCIMSVYLLHAQALSTDLQIVKDYIKKWANVSSCLACTPVIITEDFIRSPKSEDIIPMVRYTMKWCDIKWVNTNTTKDGACINFYGIAKGNDYDLAENELNENDTIRSILRIPVCANKEKPFNPDDIIPLIENLARNKGAHLAKRKYDSLGNFNEGKAWVMLGGKFGFINEPGNEITPLKYEAATNFYYGMAGVKLQRKWGFINETGEEVIPPKYDEIIEPFNDEEFARVRLGRKKFFINKEGNVLR